MNYAEIGQHSDERESAHANNDKTIMGIARLMIFLHQEMEYLKRIGDKAPSDRARDLESTIIGLCESWLIEYARKNGIKGCRYSDPMLGNGEGDRIRVGATIFRPVSCDKGSLILDDGLYSCVRDIQGMTTLNAVMRIAGFEEAT